MRLRRSQEERFRPPRIPPVILVYVDRSLSYPLFVLSLRIFSFSQAQNSV